MTASLELCKELFELKPEWDDTSGNYFYHDDEERWVFISGGRCFMHKSCDYEKCLYCRGYDSDHDIPAYDTDYLLDKLPNRLKDSKESWASVGLSRFPHVEKWRADYHVTFNPPIADVYADTPANALCKLVIKLVKEGLI